LHRALSFPLNSFCLIRNEHIRITEVKVVRNVTQVERIEARLTAQDKRIEERLSAQEILLASQGFRDGEERTLVPKRTFVTACLLPRAMIKAGGKLHMAQVVTLPTAEPTTRHDEHHGLPPFAAPMLLSLGFCYARMYSTIPAITT